MPHFSFYSRHKYCKPVMVRTQSNNFVLKIKGSRTYFVLLFNLNENNWWMVSYILRIMFISKYHILLFAWNFDSLSNTTIEMRHVTELIVDTALSKNKEKHCHVGQLTATIHSRICMKLCCNEIYPRPVLNNLRSKMRVGQPGVHSVLCSIYNDQTRFYSLLTIRL